MTTSEKIQNIATALIKAQTELSNPSKNQQGYGYKYADLSSILDQVKPVLQKHGLAITQTSSDDGNGKVGVTTTLMHESGEYISDTLRLPIPEMKGTTSTQAAGAALTYARRYAISSILNIAADEDTDAANNEKTSPKRGFSKQPQYTTRPATKPAPRPDPIMEATDSTPTVTKRCAECGATGKFHRPDCSMKNMYSEVH